ncbi:FAD-dependent oxidoreductase [Prauserella flavalba]|uniref:FAD-dependent oxidoreductase n=1 Tax=Prauserella flavalba TaxID=1477506 RepID=UPI0036E091E7
MSDEAADVRAIRALTAAYNRTFDTGDTVGWLATFFPDGELVVEGHAVYTGRDALAEFAADRVGRYHHLSADPEIEIAGDTAVQQCSLILYNTEKEGVSLVGTGRYVDELVRTSEGWRFLRRTVRMRRVASATAEHRSVVAAGGAAAVRQSPALSADVVVVGSGAGGLAAAIGAASMGSSVILLEKASKFGGTTAKSGGVFWIPGNKHQAAHGLSDDLPLALRYMARVSAPDRYDEHDIYLALSVWEYQLLSAYVDQAAEVLDRLEELGALTVNAEVGWDFPDYHCELPEQGGIRGRALAPAAPDGGVGTGTDLVDQLLVTSEKLGVQLMNDVAFTDLAVDGNRVVGVLARSPRRELFVEARGGVVLASGGFTHDPARAAAHLPGRLWGGCAVRENTGDILPALEALDVPLSNMECAWWDQVAIEHTLAATTETRAGVWVAPGDSSVIVDLSGARVVNEKAVYNTRAKIHHGEDAPQVLLLLMDQRCRELFCTEQFAYPITAADLEHGDGLISASTWDELAESIDQRLADLGEHLDGARLRPGFREELARTISRYNQAAREGVDHDFARGEQPIEHFFSGAPRPGSGPNATMAPFSDTGPYHAVLIGLGTLDTKGGPQTDIQGRVLDRFGDPTPGLYAVGNAAASPSGQGYWAAGATIGPALVFGYAAGQHAAARSNRSRHLH